MKTITIHKSSAGGDKLVVDSIGNGLALAFYFGEAGSPMRTVYFQGDDAFQIEAEFDAMENAFPDKPTRDVWLDVLEPYL